MARTKSKRNKTLYTKRVVQTNETELNMIYEPFDWKSEEKAYKAQLEKEAEDYAFALQEIQRREWAQRHGNDSGFDPYAYFDE
jgi:transposase